MARDFAIDFYRSPEWKSCRKGYIKFRAGLCERCLENGIYTPGKVVHHRIHLTPENINDPSVALGWENLKLVCQDCHAAEHITHKRYIFDADGNVIAPPQR